MTFFTNAQLVLADEVVHGSVHTNGALIQSVDAGTSSLPGGIDLEGDYLWPGRIRRADRIFQLEQAGDRCRQWSGHGWGL